MDTTPRNFTSEFATELTELSQSFSEVAQTLQGLQALLEEGNSQTKAILDTLPIPILVVESPSGTVFYVNKRGQELVGTPEVINLELDEYQMYVTATGEFCPIEKRPLRRALKGETVYEDQLEWRIRDRILPLEIWTRPIYDRQGNIIFAISVFQDSSQRKQAEKVLAETLIKQTELEAAKKIQAGLYPQNLPSLENFELACYCHPSFDVGGDLYDYHWNEAGELVITLADVMGKGMSAALLATSFRASLRLTSRQLSPGKAIAAAATAMADDLDRSESYITCVHSALQDAERCLNYVNAGHGHGFLLRKNGEVEKLGKGSPPVSPLFSELLVTKSNSFTEHDYQFQLGDIFLLYSDGLIDCKPELDLNPDKIAAIIQHSISAEEVIDRLKTVAEVEQNAIDDLTLIVLRCSA
jgi:hypothetical protein